MTASDDTAAQVSIVASHRDGLILELLDQPAATVAALLEVLREYPAIESANFEEVQCAADAWLPLELS